MKKYLLTSLLGLLAFVGFTSAVDYNISEPYNTQTITICGDDFTLNNSNFSNYSCNEDTTCGLVLYNKQDPNIYCNAYLMSSDEPLDVYGECENMPAGEYELGYGDASEMFNNIKLTIESSTCGGSSNEGGTTNNNGNIIAGGINDFSGIITKLGNIAGEFIPYIIYIAIACLGVSLAIRAVKYILEYLNNKSKGSIREIDNSTFDINFNDNTELKRHTIQPVIYKNNYEKEQARKKRIEKNKNRSDNVL